MATHNETGKRGEQLASQWLQQKGFNIMALNWRHAPYEIDIIASKEKLLHFIEVKTRSNIRFGFPEAGVSPKKIQNLLRAGEIYLDQQPQWKSIQYNILSILLWKNEEPEYFFIEDVYSVF